MASHPAASDHARPNRAGTELRVGVASDGDDESGAGSVAGLSFAADLLFNLDDVRADCASGLTAHGNLVTMLRNRVSLERTYSQELSKMARYARLDEMEHGTMKNALASLRAQYLNTSVQHQQFAKNLEEDVLKPIEILYEYNSEREQSLIRRINNVKKDVKVQEDAYRKDYSAFDKNFRDASASFAAAMDAGFSSTLLEDQYHQRLAQMNVGDCPAKERKSRSTALMIRHDKSSGVAALKTINNNKLVNWLRSSESHRKEDLASNTVKLMEAAEKSRMKCQASWQYVETNRINMYRSVQAVLADYQQIAEDRISTIATNLRKHVVFASSTLANEQVIAPKFENVDVKSDIHDFIHATRGNRDRFHLAVLTVDDLCNDTTRALVTSPSSKPCRPLRKTCLEIRDISSKKVPFDYDGNQELLCEALGTRPRGLDGAQHHQEQGARDRDISHDEYGRLRIDCSASSTENDFAADTEGNTISGVQDTDNRVEDKTSAAQQSEPEHDSDNHSPIVSPSASSDSLTAHFLNHDHPAECQAARHDSTPVATET
ncbi:FCH domain [Phytophthora cinnamomi]|uniref:FCH domain n=1 Tax=Phytophthora cinnamomi TaxID=4785 RepID=UPI00355A41D3|nr:FCH domain [Phytophthora cinnamomi]